MIQSGREWPVVTWTCIVMQCGLQNVRVQLGILMCVCLCLSRNEYCVACVVPHFAYHANLAVC